MLKNRPKQALAAASLVALSSFLLLKAEARPVPVGSPSHDFFGMKGGGDGLLGDIVASAQRVTRPGDGHFIAPARHNTHHGDRPSGVPPALDHNLPLPLTAATPDRPSGGDLLVQHQLGDAWQGLIESVPRHEPGPSQISKKTGLSRRAAANLSRQRLNSEYVAGAWKMTHSEPLLVKSELPLIKHPKHDEALLLHQQYWLQQARLRSIEAKEEYTPQDVADAAILVRKRLRDSVSRRNLKLRRKVGDDSNPSPNSLQDQRASFKKSSILQIAKQRAVEREKTTGYVMEWKKRHGKEAKTSSLREHQP